MSPGLLAGTTPRTLGLASGPSAAGTRPITSDSQRETCLPRIRSFVVSGVDGK